MNYVNAPIEQLVTSRANPFQRSECYNSCNRVNRSYCSLPHQSRPRSATQSHSREISGYTWLHVHTGSRRRHSLKHSKFNRGMGDTHVIETHYSWMGTHERVRNTLFMCGNTGTR